MTSQIQSYFKKSLSYENGVYLSSEALNYSYPKEGSDYFETEHETSFWYKHRNMCILSLVQMFSSEKEFFDIGGGNGFVSKFLQDSGYDIVLMDPQKPAIINAQRRGVKNLICSTFSSELIYENSLTNVGLFDILEHIKDDFGFLKELNCCMKPSSFLYITVPANPSLWSYDDIWAGHFRRYKLSKLNKLLSDSGFDVVYSSHYFLFLPLGIFLLKTIPFRFGLKKNANENIRRKLVNKKNLLGEIIKKVCLIELRRISKKKHLSYGSSCIVVAKKK